MNALVCGGLTVYHLRLALGKHPPRWVKLANTADYITWASVSNDVLKCASLRESIILSRRYSFLIDQCWLTLTRAIHRRLGLSHEKCSWWSFPTPPCLAGLAHVSLVSLTSPSSLKRKSLIAKTYCKSTFPHQLIIFSFFPPLSLTL